MKVRVSRKIKEYNKWFNKFLTVIPKVFDNCTCDVGYEDLNSVRFVEKDALAYVLERTFMEGVKYGKRIKK